MVGALARRGPDSEGFHVFPSASFGHRRLSIYDLSDAGKQPMLSPDGQLAVVFNGAIYNHLELRAELVAAGYRFKSHTDTEVLLHAIDHWGARAALDKLRGMFSFVSVRHIHGRVHVFAAIDPAGMKPLAWTIAPDPDAPNTRTLLLASDCDALRDLMPVKPALDPIGLCHVLSIGYSPAPGTVWSGVQKFVPGTFLEWSTGDAAPTLGTYWSPPNHAADEADAEVFEHLLARITREHLIGDVPVGMFLSAGLDSASIALALADSGADVSRIAGYTLSTSAPTDEAADASSIARMLGMPEGTVKSHLHRARVALGEMMKEQ